MEIKNRFTSKVILSVDTLAGVNLSEARLFNVLGNGKEIKTYQPGLYTINVTKDIIFIGCEGHTLDEWLTFTDSKINSMAPGALKWRIEHKQFVIQVAGFSN